MGSWLQPSQNSPSEVQGGAQVAPDLEEPVCPTLCFKVGPPYIGEGHALSHANLSSSFLPQRRCPLQACCLVKGLLASLLGSWKWTMQHIPHLIIVPPRVVQCFDLLQDSPGKGS